MSTPAMLKKTRAIVRRWLRNYRASFNGEDLVRLARIFRTDKWGSHWYAQHYNRHFAPLRKRKLTILEIGVGGDADPRAGGESLRTWKWFFRRSQIVGIDIHDKKALEEHRIRVYQGSQDDGAFLKRVVDEVGRPDIVIDDGSHENGHVITSFKVLFPLLQANGIYVVEDTQTSYWPSFGGLVHERHSDQTTMGFFKGLIDGLNFSEYLLPGYVPSFYDQHIVALHFYHNLILIYKGLNDEGSNLVHDGTLRGVPPA